MTSENPRIVAVANEARTKKRRGEDRAILCDPQEVQRGAKPDEHHVNGGVGTRARGGGVEEEEERLAGPDGREQCSS